MRAQFGPRNPKWKGGTTTTKEGYVRVKTKKNRDKYEHRLIVEQQQGRKLSRSTHVHHRNRVRDDNRLSNLQPLPASQHPKYREGGNPPRRKSKKSVLDILRDIVPF